MISRRERARRAPIALVWLATGGALVACAGSADTRAPASSPEPAGTPAAPAQTKALAPNAMSNDATTPSPAAGASMAPQAPAPPPAPASERREESAPSATADAARDRSGSRPSGQAALGELGRAEHEIAAGDCSTACRALGSMERAVSFICAQAYGDGDTSQCDDAKRRLAASRKHVRSSCGSCAGGPSVDPDAPVPSSR